MNGFIKLVINFILILLVYCNIDALCKACKIKPIKVDNQVTYLPNHWIITRLFLSFNLYGSWSKISSGYEAWGRVKKTKKVITKPLPTDLKLNIYEYFPQLLGEANRNLRMISYSNNEKKLKSKYKKLCQDILRLHNQQNPKDKLSQVLIYNVIWPKSTEGYYHNYEQRDYFLLCQS